MAILYLFEDLVLFLIVIFIELMLLFLIIRFKELIYKIFLGLYTLGISLFFLTKEEYYIFLILLISVNIYIIFTQE